MSGGAYAPSRVAVGAPADRFFRGIYVLSQGPNQMNTSFLRNSYSV